MSLKSNKQTLLKVFYSGMIDGLSPAKTLVMFTHEGSISTTETEVTIAPLTPATSYIFEISALTSRGRGQDVLIEALTASAESNLGMSGNSCKGLLLPLDLIIDS